MCVGVLAVCVCTPCTCRGQKRALDPLRLEFEMEVSLPVYAGSQTLGLWDNSKCSLTSELLSNVQYIILTCIFFYCG